MTKVIPPGLIEHLAWTPGRPEPPKPIPPPAPPRAPQTSAVVSPFSIENIIARGQSFYDGKTLGSLKKALEYATPEGILVTMPEMINAKAKADKSHTFWQEWKSVHTEENIGIDKSGIHYSRNTPVLILVSGGGLLTPERIETAYAEGLISGSAKYTAQEFKNILEGKIPDGTTIPMHTLEEVKSGKITNYPHKFGIVMPYQEALGTVSGRQEKGIFMVNPLVIARSAGALDSLETYFEKAKGSDGVGSYHPFSGRDPAQPQGRVLYVNSDNDGLIGSYDLDFDASFVGVAPEAPSRAKK